MNKLVFPLVFLILSSTTIPFMPHAQATTVNVEYLVVGAGGAGGSGGGYRGGGGAGGMLSGTGHTINLDTTYTITVGAGASGNGGNSVFDTYTAVGGGNGGYYNGVAGSSGGSGGGGGGGGGAGGGSGTAGQGNSGGSSPSGNYGGGGGGGKGGAGTSSYGSNCAGTGGSGESNSITGTAVTYSVGARGTSNTGCNASDKPGWGNAGSGGFNGAKGTDGVVIIRFLTSAGEGTGGTVSYDGDYSVHTFTTSGTFSITVPEYAHESPTLDTVSQTPDTAELNLSWTEDPTNADDSQQPAKTNSTVYTGDTFYYQMPLLNSNATQNNSNSTHAGNIDTSGAEIEGLFHFDDDFGTSSTPLISFDFSDTNGVTNRGTGGSTYDATNYGATTGQTGIRDEAYDYSGTDQFSYLTIPASEVINGHDIGSFSVWYYADALHSGVLFGCTDGSSYGTKAMGLYHRSDSNNLHWLVRNGGTMPDNLTITTGHSYETWNHIVATNDGSGATKFYINGVQTTSASTSNWFNYNSGYDQCTIGAFIGDDPATESSQEWNGLIDDFNYFDYTLTEAEITELYNSGASVDASLGLTAFDQSTNDDHGTVNTISTGTATIKSSHINSNYSNEVQFENAGLNVTSSNYPQNQDAWSVSGIITLNQTTSFPLMSWDDGSSNEVLLNIDDSFIGLSKGGIDIFNHTLTTPMGNPSPQAITIKRSTSGEYETFVNGTRSPDSSTTDTTTLGKPTNNLYHFGLDTSLANAGTWRMDELLVTSSELSDDDVSDYGKRIVPFTELSTGETGTTYTDTSVGYEDSQCYYITTFNIIGESLPSNILCGTSDAELVVESGGGGGGGGGSAGAGGGGQSGNPDSDNTSELLSMQLSAQSNKLTLGEVKQSSLSINWNLSKDIQVNKILVGDSPLRVSFPVTPFKLIGDESGFSSAEIGYTLKVPENLCSDTLTINCVEFKEYQIPVTVLVLHEGLTIPVEAPITADLTETAQFGFLIVVGLIGMVVSAIAYKTIKGRGSRKSNGTKRSSTKSTKKSSSSNGTKRTSLSKKS